MNDSCYRRIQMLRHIPIQPARISTSDLAFKMQAQGIEIHVRTLQRDLNSLSNLFEIENDGNKDIPGWYWRKDADKLELPEMEPSVALSFRMVKLFLERFMPPSTFEELNPYFKHGNKILDSLSKNHLSDWSNKVALLSRNQPLLSPDIDPENLAIIYQALLSDFQIKAHYHPRQEDPRDYTINPLGIVVVDQIIYLVGTLWEYKDIKQFALHRFKSVELTNNPISGSEEFNLQNYIEKGHFEYLVNQEQIEIKVRITKWLSRHLSENKLVNDQIIDEKDGAYTLQAKVKNTQQLRWWLSSFGTAIEVLEPHSLREEFKEMAKKMCTKYQK